MKTLTSLVRRAVLVGLALFAALPARAVWDSTTGNMPNYYQLCWGVNETACIYGNTVSNSVRIQIGGTDALTINSSGNATFSGTLAVTGGLTNASINALGVDTTKLNADAVTTAKILNSAVDTTKLNADAVTTAKILNSAVDTTKLASDSVTTAKILNSAVDTNKVAADAIDTTKLLAEGQAIDTIRFMCVTNSRNSFSWATVDQVLQGVCP